jgi:hypothetical protein
MQKQLLIYIQVLLVTLLLTLTACGGGGGGGSDTPPPVIPAPPVTQTVVLMTLDGGGDTIGSVYFEINLPDGFDLATTVGGDLIAGVLSTDQIGAYFESTYLPETISEFGQIQFSLIKADGFTTGEAILTRTMVEGEILPLVEDFGITALIVTDLNGVELTGYTYSFTVESQETIL